jgi:NitT/TauT family transport system substrate-binding protein
MLRMIRRIAPAVFALTLLAVPAATAPAGAQDLPTLHVGSITGPLANPIVWNIMKDRGFDKKHGFNLDIKLYPSIAAFYAGFTTGEVDAIMGGPSNFANLRQQGVPLKIVATTLKLGDLGVFTKQAAIKTLTDLRGKQLAIDMGGSQYQIVSMVARAKNLNLKTDVTLVDANFGIARAQLEADRVDAAMVAEPLATMMLQQDPSVRMIFSGNDGWKALTGHDGWENVAAIREDALAKLPADAPVRLIAALTDTVAFMRASPDAADKIVADTTKLPPGVFKAALIANRLDFEIHDAWTGQRAVIIDMFRRAVADGFAAKMPDDAIFYAPRS